MAISKQQSMRPAEIELIDASNQHESTLQAHTQSLETLDASLSTETTGRESADTALGTRIDGEVQARTDADTALGTRIDNEAQARTDADTALGTRIDNEVQARTDGDATLQGQIDALAAIGAEPNVIDSISVNGVAQTVTDKNVDITASSVVDGNDIAPSSVAATGNVSGRSVSDSVGSLADLRDSVSHGVNYGQGNGNIFYEEWGGNHQLVMNFNGNFVEDGVTYDILQVQFNKTSKSIAVQANKKGGSWVKWFTINGS